MGADASGQVFEEHSSLADGAPPPRRKSRRGSGYRFKSLLHRAKMSTSPYNPATLYDVSGLVAVVTGGGTGLGLIIAKTLEHNGAKVYITGRRQEKLDEAVKQAAHGNIIAIAGSTTSREDTQRAVDIITKETGHIDLLINNAGQTTFLGGPGVRSMPSADAPLAEVRDYFFNYRDSQDWVDTLNTNISGVFTTSMAFLELLDAGNKRRAKELPTSQIITIGSVGGLTRHTESFIYNASKAAAHHLMMNLGSYFVRFDIRTNVIAPGWFPTDVSVSTFMRSEWTEIEAELCTDDDERGKAIREGQWCDAADGGSAAAYGAGRGVGRNSVAHGVQGGRVL
nr:rhamnolipids biosynthesis 3-oxoacyl-[acyl-carrier-protein] reductase [Quercus suber]